MNPLIIVAFVIGILAGLALVYVFRERPERIQRATDFGAPQDVIERQRMLMRRMRTYGWVVVAWAAVGLLVTFLVTR